MIKFYKHLVLDRPYKAKIITPFVEIIELVTQPFSFEQIMATTAPIPFTPAALPPVFFASSTTSAPPRPSLVADNGAICIYGLSVGRKCSACFHYSGSRS